MIGLGKAAASMSAAAREVLDKGAARRRNRPELIIDEESGDHPLPGPRSEKASNELEAFLSQIKPGDSVLVLLSGGTSSLIASPVNGIPPEDLVKLFQLLLASGLDIHQMNLIRKRFCRWGAGRLAERIAGASVQVLAMSDVSGDRLESIGSGPCVPDPSTAEEVVALLQKTRQWARIPPVFKAYLDDVQGGRRPETPKPGNPAFDLVTHQIVAGNQTALEAAIQEARKHELRAEIGPEFAGPAVEAGRRLVQAAARLTPSSCLLFGGETTVVLPGDSGRGGRCQEVALSAALELERRGQRGITLLVAGTDGRDGPTDVAGAVVDPETVKRIRLAGLDPIRHLTAHDAYPALDAAGCLVRTGPTGTNVRDVVVAIRMLA